MPGITKRPYSPGDEYRLEGFEQSQLDLLRHLQLATFHRLWQCELLQALTCFTLMEELSTASPEGKGQQWRKRLKRLETSGIRAGDPALAGYSALEEQLWDLLAEEERKSHD